jgi:hypothetical protein
MGYVIVLSYFRLFHGGLPATLLASAKSPGFYREWMDSFFSRDIQRIFRFRDPEKFNTLFEYIMKQSGGLLEVTRTASALGISRPTIENHLHALEMLTSSFPDPAQMSTSSSANGIRSILTPPRSESFALTTPMAATTSSVHPPRRFTRESTAISKFTSAIRRLGIATNAPLILALGLADSEQNGGTRPSLDHAEKSCRACSLAKGRFFDYGASA